MEDLKNEAVDGVEGPKNTDGVRSWLADGEIAEAVELDKARFRARLCLGTLLVLKR